MNGTILRRILIPSAALAMTLGTALYAQQDPSAPSAAEAVVMMREGGEPVAVVSAPQSGAATAVGTVGIETAKAPAPAPEAAGSADAQPSAAEVLARGEYLVNILACNDCHTPMKMGPQGPAPDMSRMLSGHPEGMKMTAPSPMPPMPWVMVGSDTNTAFAGPWGISYAPNLTPDQNTGMGIWTEQMFVDALRTGRHMGTSRPIMPPMPWPSYSRMTDADLKAVYAYLRSVPALQNRVPDYEPPTGAEEPLPAE